MKRLLTAALFLLAMGGTARAGTEGAVDATPVFDDNGNTWRSIGVTMSTFNCVLVSSASDRATLQASTSSLGIATWRFREIVNVSTWGALALYPTNNYNQFSSTMGIVLSSDATGGGFGDSWVVPHQGEVWGIWSPGANAVGAGAGGSESYWSTAPDPSKRR